MSHPYYYGEGIRSRRLSAHRSDAFLAEMKKQARKDHFDYFASYQETEKLIEQWRELPYCMYSRKYETITQSPKQLHQQAMQRNVIRVNPSQISMLFHPKKEITLKNNGLITTEIDKVTFYYQLSVNDFEVIKNYSGERVVMSFDLFDTAKVYLWKKHGNLLVWLCEASLFEQIQRHGPTADLGKISEARAREKALQRLREEALQKEMQGSEEELLMGVFTNKRKANGAEDAFYLEAKPKPVPVLKKVTGGEYFEAEELEVDVTNMY